MATDKTLDSNRLFLLPGRFGPAKMFKPPRDGFVPLAAGNTEAMFRPGTVCQVYNNGAGAYGIEGFSELVYLQYDDGGGFTSAAKEVSVPGSDTLWFQVQNDHDDGTVDATGNPHAVVTLSAALADTNFAWFWCGGVSPEQYVTGMGGTFQTDNSFANTTDLNLACGKLSADTIGLIAGDGATEAHIGMALAIAS